MTGNESRNRRGGSIEPMQCRDAVERGTSVDAHSVGPSACARGPAPRDNIALVAVVAGDMMALAFAVALLQSRGAQVLLRRFAANGDREAPPQSHEAIHGMAQTGEALGRPLPRRSLWKGLHVFHCQHILVVADLRQGGLTPLVEHVVLGKSNGVRGSAGARVKRKRGAPPRGEANGVVSWRHDVGIARATGGEREQWRTTESMRNGLNGNAAAVYDKNDWIETFPNRSIVSQSDQRDAMANLSVESQGSKSKIGRRNNTDRLE